MALDLADLRLAVYRHFVDEGAAPSPVELSDHFGVAPGEVEASLKSLQDDLDALVLLPGSSYIWMAEPFSATPTSYRVVADDGRRWFGNCVWDAVAILTLVGVDGDVATRDRHTGEALTLRVVDGALASASGVVHFAVPAKEWWKSIGFT